MTPALQSRRKVAYLDVFTRRGALRLVIANNVRHDEIWRRSDDKVMNSVRLYVRFGVEVFYHLE
jgi:hypothetical protein